MGIRNIEEAIESGKLLITEIPNNMPDQEKRQLLEDVRLRVTVMGREEKKRALLKFEMSLGRTSSSIIHNFEGGSFEYTTYRDVSL